ncbi:MAG: Lrp/AsnC family transcriptional regulator [Weeksellaceae bacterium]|nr:Lrp/AsnC family transcriptional regulator [Weeksellaceae bacterium]
MKLDETDVKILNQLTANSKQSVKELAKKVNLSPTPVHERIKKMENAGVITNYKAVIDHEKLGLKLVVYLQLKFTMHNQAIFKEFSEYVQTLEEVKEVHFIAGEYDVLMKVLLSDMSHYNDFILNKISQLSNTHSMRSYFVMTSLKSEDSI